MNSSSFPVEDESEDNEASMLYLAACFAEDKGDGRTIKEALNRIARTRGMSELAKATGLTRAGLYRALSPEGDPKLTTILKIMKALELTR